MVAQSTDPNGYSSGQTPRFLLKKGTPRNPFTLIITGSTFDTTVAGYHGHLNFLKAVNAYSPDFSVTQIITVKDAMFGSKDPAELPPVQKLVERFRSHIRLRKAQGATAEQLLRGAFGVTLNGETPNQTDISSDNRNNNRNNNSNQNNNGSRNNGNGNGNNRPIPKCFYKKLYRFKGCPYINKNVKPDK
ncbi:hypothetical protein DL771_006981 [Monosporascus sp. 5C6A]|nr:hypothetical protein DL771_006981 [Monosporascus sp. 5C6A]